MNVDATVILSELPLVLASAVPDAVTVLDDDTDSTTPADVRNWLARLRLLENVPFANLVADTELLPPESIRWFYVDRRWTDAVVQGALSVGTVNTDDRTHLTATYGAIREELDREERNLRRRPEQRRLAGDGGPISGFLLRSAAVSGWPALHVRAFSVDPVEADDAEYPEDDPRRMRLLRLERLAPAVLLCLFDGIPKVVHIEEPRQGVQFGLDAVGEGANLTATLRPRKAADFTYLDVRPIPVPFRPGSTTGGVIDIQALEAALAAHPETGAADHLDSAEYALQLVRFPFRQVFGEPEGPGVATVFRPTVAYRVMVEQTFSRG